jgi:hypothetical protein
VKLKVDPKTVQGVLRHEDFGTTMELYAQSDMDSMRDAQGKFLEQLIRRQNPPAHRARSVSIMGWIVGWKFPLFATKFFEMSSPLSSLK